MRSLGFLSDDCGAFSVPCCMFSSTIGAFVCFGVVFNYTIFWFVAGSTGKAASLSVSAVDCHVSEALTLEALGRLGVSLKELAMVLSESWHSCFFILCISTRGAPTPKTSIQSFLHRLQLSRFSVVSNLKTTSPLWSFRTD